MTRTHLDQSRTVTIGIIGGGFTGATLAAQLLRRADPSLRVIVVERSSSPGRGVAYSTQFNWHLLNVPAGKMSMFPDEPQHFLRWSQRNYDRMVGAESFLPRRVYGQYVDAVLREVQTASAGRLHWLQDEAVMVQPGTRGAEILLRSGERMIAQKVVLALGNLPPSDPPLPGITSQSSRYFGYAWSAAALNGVEDESDVLLIGSGLTSVDMAMALRAREFKGTIHILSRRGLLPHPHRAAPDWPLFWNHESPRTVRGLLRLVRSQIDLAHRQGNDWRSVIDSLRPVTTEIWQSLPEVEKRRFLRHLRVHWEVRRHRVAPEVGKLLGLQLIDGRVRVHAGRVLTYRESAEAVEIGYRERQSGNVTHFRVDRVINCTGPETDCRKLEDVLLADLRSQGLVRPDPLFLGLDVSGSGAVRDRQGKASGILYAVGPARKGQLWETTAVPEIRAQVAQLAEQLLRECEKPVRLVPRMNSFPEKTQLAARDV